MVVFFAIGYQHAFNTNKNTFLAIDFPKTEMHHSVIPQHF